MENNGQVRKSRSDMPDKGDSNPANDDLPTLSELLIGFQKSMARVAQATARAAKEDPLFLYGRRNLYYIDEVDVETVVGIRPARNDEKGTKPNFETIRILTEDKGTISPGEPSAGWTRLKFKLTGRDLDEYLRKPYIFIRLDKYRKKEKDYLIELQVMNSDGTPAVCSNITVEILPEADEKKKKSLSGLTTNELGIVGLRLIFRKDPKRKTRMMAILTDGKVRSPQIAQAKTYLIRALAGGQGMRPPLDIEEILSYAPLIINYSTSNYSTSEED